MSLSLEGITKKVGRETHISNISLSFEVGSRNILLGRTLAGKTSLLRLMAGLDRTPKLGGLVDFYRSPARVAWTPTGTNVPDYPKLNKCIDPNVWLNKPGSPKAKVNEKPKGITVDYNQLIKAWQEGRVK